METLAPDVVAIVDGGGVVSAARRPVRGQAKVARFVLALIRTWEQTGEVSFQFDVYNGMPALLVLIDGKLDSLTCVEIHDGLVIGVYGVRNPSKLAGVYA